MPLRVRTGNQHGAALDRSDEISRDEIALMRSFEAIARLLEMQGMRRLAREVCDLHIPLTADIRCRRRDARGF